MGRTIFTWNVVGEQRKIMPFLCMECFLINSPIQKQRKFVATYNKKPKKGEIISSSSLKYGVITVNQL
jgi:hypothetical protein